MVLRVEAWGAALYGDPCRECGFEWDISSITAVERVTEAPEIYEGVTRTATGCERRVDGGWTVAEYVCHVGDNLRQWAERVQAGRLSGSMMVEGYDPDELARARQYSAVPLGAALWSLSRAVTDWAEVIRYALDEAVVLDHRTRGPQRAEDIARNNGHDVHHHVWDIRSILS